MSFFDHHWAFDFETSGLLPEYALQPWRVRQCKAWSTSLVWISYDAKAAKALVEKRPFPDIDSMAHMLTSAIEANVRLVGWNTVFDIQWLLAAGLDDLVFKAKWLDGMLIWKHATVEPEYDLTRAKRKPYSLKDVVPELWPEHAGYEEAVDYHSTDEAELAKLEAYNVKDVVFTLRATKHWWERLTPAQQRCALIEAESLPVIAKANLEGVMVDTLVAGDLRQHLTEEAERSLELLSPHGVDETIVRSPDKLRHLMFDVWGLRPHHTTDKGKFSTDKETLHELGMTDWRAKTLRTYREALNNRTKFATAAINSVRYNGDFRTHPQFHVYSTYCVPGEVEVLTREGWVRLDEWAEGEIVQARPDLTLEFLPATRFVGPEVDEWVHVRQRALDCLFTPGHIVPFLNPYVGYKWETRSAGDLGRGVRMIPVAGTLTLGGTLTADQMRLLAARKLFGPWIFDTTAEGLTAFIAELELWDSSSYSDGGFKFSSSIRENVEWAVTAAALTGRKASMHARSAGMWECHVSDLSIRPVRAVRPKDYSIDHVSRRAYCATTQTGFWLARSSGHIFITGNTGRLTVSSGQALKKKKKEKKA